MDSHSTDILPGTLDLLILKAVSLKRLHGYGVLLHIQQISQRVLNVPQGSLYPALNRLEHQGLIASTWGESENKCRAKYYTLTVAGRRRLKQETAGWERLVSGMTAIGRRHLKTETENWQQMVDVLSRVLDQSTR